MTRAAEVAAALERWERAKSMHFHGAESAGDTLAALLRESQPEPASVVGDDEALLADLELVAKYSPNATIMDTVRRGIARLHAALADVGRLKEEQDKEAREWNDLRDRYDATVLELTQARAALAAAEQEKEKAVADWQKVIDLMPIKPKAVTYDLGWKIIDAAQDAVEAIRARAGRNDAPEG